MKHIYLSYPLSSEIPAYGSRAAIDVRKIKSISEGNAANESRFTLNCHWGTHVDLPNHFFPKGKKIISYSAKFWNFRYPQAVDVRLKASAVLRLGKWTDGIKRNSDILLFRSGWGKYRKQKKYYLDNPGIHPEVGLYLRKFFPRLRAIGIDWISISSYKNRSLGRDAHRAFLNPRGRGRSILLVEDMDLSGRRRGLKEVNIAPLRVEDADSALCTVTGVYDD